MTQLAAPWPGSDRPRHHAVPMDIVWVRAKAKGTRAREGLRGTCRCQQGRLPIGTLVWGILTEAWVHPGNLPPREKAFGWEVEGISSRLTAKAWAASFGRSPSLQPVSIPEGNGLKGRRAESCLPQALADGSNLPHPCAARNQKEGYHRRTHCLCRRRGQAWPRTN